MGLTKESMLLSKLAVFRLQVDCRLQNTVTISVLLCNVLRHQKVIRGRLFEMRIKFDNKDFANGRGPVQ